MPALAPHPALPPSPASAPAPAHAVLHCCAQVLYCCALLAPNQDAAFMLAIAWTAVNILL